MFYVRSTPTKSGAVAIQVVKYLLRKTVVVKHIGSGRNPGDIPLLKTAARQWIEEKTAQMRLFSNKEDYQFTNTSNSSVLVLNQSQLISTNSIFAYEALQKLCHRLGFGKLTLDYPLEGKLLLDLVIVRLIHPSSKLEALRFLQNQLGIVYQKHTLYRRLLNWGKLKDEVENTVINFAKQQLGFDFNIVFYDVTTLYYESFKNDQELRQFGFSKDNKFHQPQIIIGLVVNHQGFPLSYGVFPGNKFEGHTFIPMIKDLKRKHKIKSFTVVADAAMISQNNVKQLLVNKLHYIVGARLGNLNQPLIKQICQKLNHVDGSTIRLSTVRGDLICAFSQKRYQKNKHETKKQIQKAKTAIRNPGKRKRLKFLTSINSQLTLNQKLIEKTKLLWGIKGYYTNLNLVNSHQEIINHYHQLWQVEKAFRITKSDLQARPIYHHKTKAIKAHILICFMALAIAKYLEIQSGLSLRRCLSLLESVQDAKIKNQLSQIITLRSKPSKTVENLLKKLSLSY